MLAFSQLLDLASIGAKLDVFLGRGGVGRGNCAKVVGPSLFVARGKEGSALQVERGADEFLADARMLFRDFFGGATRAQPISLSRWRK